ncbi:hypothetical protein [Robertmurraya andreesenii]|uniref:DUF551 domain-containing protein n=1 Tax=Anoxybacillus andreesenii TaxID=1325932 RepID=A0ABT9V1Z9_9BACL|nr:hypothetical protein [Robertmurraya andreesenii]MDQ0154975.1 hypothetical protein [Robertmurraya andreesenii]
MNWLKRLFKRHKFDDFALEPAYQPGDVVVLFNPYVLDGMVSDDIRPPRVEIVKQSAFVSNVGVYVYQFDGDDAWYNESWLFPAVYGTETLWVDFPKVQSKR